MSQPTSFQSESYSTSFQPPIARDRFSTGDSFSMQLPYPYVSAPAYDGFTAPRPGLMQNVYCPGPTSIVPQMSQQVIPQPIMPKTHQAYYIPPQQPPQSSNGSNNGSKQAPSQPGQIERRTTSSSGSGKGSDDVASPEDRVFDPTDIPPMGIQRQSNQSDQAERVRWTFDSERMFSSGMVEVSPQFMILNVPFKVFIQPYFQSEEYSHQAKKGKGRASFKAANGVVEIKLKCESTAELPKLQLRFFVNGSKPRGPICHDFGVRPVGTLAPAEAKWRMQELCKDLATCTICIEAWT